MIQQHKKMFLRHKTSLKEIANGKYVWDQHASKEVLEFRELIKQKWLHLPSNTQITIRWVKDSNECLATGNSKKYVHQVSMCRSATVMRFNEIVAKRKKFTVLKGKY